MIGKGIERAFNDSHFRVCEGPGGDDLVVGFCVGGCDGCAACAVVDVGVDAGSNSWIAWIKAEGLVGKGEQAIAAGADQVVAVEDACGVAISRGEAGGG